MKRKKNIWLILIAVLALALAFLLLYDNSEEMPYKEFRTYAVSGRIASAVFSDNEIRFHLDDSNKEYRTVNPGSSELAEMLLMNGSDVRNSSQSTLDDYLNLVFDALFLGIVVFALYKLIAAYRNTFHLVRHTGVHFSDIAGMHDLKKEMMAAVDVLKGKKVPGVREPGGIILEGAPGNGKTLFAKALAEEAGVNFIASKGADFQGAVMGLGAAKVKMLFSKARRCRPCIIFIDEFDSIGEKRNYAGSGIDKENNRIITTLLNEMDGFKSSSGVLVIAATNSYESLDPALIRPGRFDLKFHISNPDSSARAELIDIYTKDKKLSGEISRDRLVSLFEGLSASAIEAVLNEAQMMAGMRDGIINARDIELSAAKTDVRLCNKRR